MRIHNENSSAKRKENCGIHGGKDEYENVKFNKISQSQEYKYHISYHILALNLSVCMCVCLFVCLSV